MSRGLGDVYKRQIKDSNMAKVLDGNYANKTGVLVQPKSGNIFLDIAQEERGVLF